MSNLKTFIEDIDFAMLKEQKKELLKVMFATKDKEVEDNLYGITLIIDKIQDIAVDEFGYKENEVFNLEEVKS